MSAYVVVHASPKNANKMQEYGAAAGPMLGNYGGELVCRGPIQMLAGESNDTLMVVLKFPTKQAAEDWYNSPEYQAVIPTRMEAMDSAFFLAGE